MKFDQPHDLSQIIKVIGVGGGGSNAVNHMFAQGIKGVDFLVCNTDSQALDISPVPSKLQLGAALTEGLGAGSIPERGKDAAQENLEQIRQLLSQRTKMVFITAGMGGGTGTGAAPVIARTARELGILTVGIVTLPFQWEGRKRRLQATAGIEELRQAVDTLLIINNDRLRDLYGNLSLDNAFEHADNVLSTAARGIAEVITITGKVNVDFEDVKTVMTNSGVAIMGMSEAEGEDRALRAAQEALASPLLNDNDIKGAKYVLLNITHGEREVLMDEIAEITDHIQDAAGSSADVIWGYCEDKSLGDRIRVTLIATGFDRNPEIGGLAVQQPERKVIPLDAPVPTMITRPIANPVTGQAVPAKPVAPVKEAVKTEPYLKTVAAAPVATPPPTPVAAPVAVTPAAPPAPAPQPVVAVAPPQPVDSAPPPVVAAPPPPPVVSAPPPPVEQAPATPVVREGRPVAPWMVNTPPPIAAVPPTPVTEREIEFEVTNTVPKAEPVAQTPPPAPPVEEKKVFRLEQDEAPARGDASAPPPPTTGKPAPATHQRGVEERLARMRELSLKLRTPSGLVDLEREPAYKRKNVALTASPQSTDNNISRYSLTEETDENGEKRVELKRNNPYLHDNVD